jgi:hypothetical protein
VPGGGTCCADHEERATHGRQVSHVLDGARERDHDADGLGNVTRLGPHAVYGKQGYEFEQDRAQEPAQGGSERVPAYASTSPQQRDVVS